MNAVPAEKLSLYALDGIYRDAWFNRMNLLSQVEDADGEITDEQIERLDELDDIVTMTREEIEVKAMSICRMVAEQSVEIEGLKAEEARIKQLAASVADRRKRIENEAERWTQYVQRVMEENGITEIKDGTNKIKISETPGRCVVENTYAVPPEYLRSVSVDSTAMDVSSWVMLIGLLRNAAADVTASADAKTALPMLRGKKDRKGNYTIEPVAIPGLSLAKSKKLKFS